MKGYLDGSRSTPRRSTRTAGSRPATSARIDADGMVTITGRVKDIIIRNMENISAKEVEDVLFTPPRDRRRRGDRRARPEDRGAVVRGHRAEGPDVADLLGVRVRPRAGSHDAEDPGAARDRRRAPRNPTGKVLKFELKDRFGGFPSSPHPPTHPLTQRRNHTPMALLDGKVAIVTGAGTASAAPTAWSWRSTEPPWS